MESTVNIEQENLRELPVQLRLDLYVEVVIAALIEQGKVDPAKLYIKPKGTFTRSYQRDLAKIEIIGKNLEVGSATYLSINREGLYDMLPEGLFHTNTNKTRHIDTEESVRELKIHRKEEKSARKFFLPLEQMFYQQRIAIEIEEQKSLIGLSEAIVDELITEFWKIPVRLDYYQSLCLAYMLPMMHQIVGNFELTAQSLSVLLQVPVTLSRGMIEPEAVELEDNRLNRFRLGDDFQLGDLYIPELDPLVVSVGPVPADTLPAYLKQDTRNEFFEFLASYFFPAELDWEIELKVDPSQESFRLGDISGKGLLNYTTVI